MKKISDNSELIKGSYEVSESEKERSELVLITSENVRNGDGSKTLYCDGRICYDPELAREIAAKYSNTGILYDFSSTPVITKVELEEQTDYKFLIQQYEKAIDEFDEVFGLILLYHLNIDEKYFSIYGELEDAYHDLIRKNFENGQDLIARYARLLLASYKITKVNRALKEVSKIIEALLINELT